MGRGKSDKNLELIAVACEILEAIQPASVRAVCYQLFLRQLIASMAKNETNKVSTQLTWAREHGDLPWAWIVDETREAERVPAWEDPAAFVETVRRSYRRDRWAQQPLWIEVWSEKGTVRGTLAPVLQKYGVTFRVMHGYGSATALHDVAMETRRRRRTLIVLYVGDWDPSGLHMSEVDLPARLAQYGGNVELVRVALTAEDTRANLPWFPVGAKRGDSRYQWFINHVLHTVDLRTIGPPTRKRDPLQERFRCFELDALSPVDLRARVERAITDRIDFDLWDLAGLAESAECESITSILDTWPGISRQAHE